MTRAKPQKEATLAPAFEMNRGGVACVGIEMETDKKGARRILLLFVVSVSGSLSSMRYGVHPKCIY